MRFVRFSLRWLLILAAFVSASLYVFYFRPTAAAKEFCHAVDLEAQSNCESVGNKYFGGMNWGGASLEHRIYSRSWSDFLHCRQRFSLSMAARTLPDGEQLVATRDYYSTLFGVRSAGDPALETREHRQ
jgi:hypothetical protein